MSDHTGHERRICSCGAVISQCRCADPKPSVVVQEGCAKCRGGAVAMLTTVAEWEQARQARTDFADACTLLRRAALVVTAYESGAAALEHAHDDDLLLADIGAFLARAGKT